MKVALPPGASGWIANGAASAYGANDNPNGAAGVGVLVVLRTTTCDTMGIPQCTSEKLIAGAPSNSMLNGPPRERGCDQASASRLSTIHVATSDGAAACIRIHISRSICRVRWLTPSSRNRSKKISHLSTETNSRSPALSWAIRSCACRSWSSYQHHPWCGAPRRCCAGQPLIQGQSGGVGGRHDVGFRAHRHPGVQRGLKPVLRAAKCVTIRTACLHGEHDTDSDRVGRPSMARGRPSSRRQIVSTAPAFSGVNRNDGSAAWARSTTDGSRRTAPAWGLH
jgi:hypothetical protein